MLNYAGAVLPKAHVPELGAAFSWSWAGVEVFFVISGFIIPYILIVGDYRLKDFGNFIGKRFVRICPPSYVIIALVLCQWWLFDHVFKANHTYTANLSVPQVVTNLLYIAPFLNYEWINGVFWTLAIEFQFYILIGLVFTLAFRNLYRFLVFSALVLALYYVPVPHGEYFFKHGSLFMMGGIASLFYTKRVSRAAFLIVTALLSAAAYFQIGSIAAAFGLATTLIVAFVQFDNKAGAFLGKISYSLYLFHLVSAPVFEIALVKLIAPVSTAGKIAVQALCLVSAILCAYLFYLLVERHSIVLANRLFAKRKTETPVLQASAAP